MTDEIEVKAREFAIVPREATEAMLRPFHECPADELPLAWEAALFIGSKISAALRQRPVVDDAMVERAWLAGMREYAKLTFSHEDDPDAIDLAAMRAALLAAIDGGQ